jgi:hypothetical protein
MDKTAVLALFDNRMRKHVPADGGASVERDGPVVRQVGGGNGWNAVVWSDLDERTADAAIAAQVRYFTELGYEFEWKVYGHDRPGDLATRRRVGGFVPEAPETLMVAEVAGLPAGTEPPEGVRVLPVTDAAGVELVIDVHEQAFGTDGGALRRQLLAQLAGDGDTVAAVVAMAGDVPVSAARMELHPGTGFAGLWGGAPWKPGAARGSTAPWSPSAPGSPPSAATATCRSTPPTRAVRSCCGWGSCR